MGASFSDWPGSNHLACTECRELLDCSYSHDQQIHGWNGSFKVALLRWGSKTSVTAWTVVPTRPQNLRFILQYPKKTSIHSVRRWTIPNPFNIFTLRKQVVSRERGTHRLKSKASPFPNPAFRCVRWVLSSWRWTLPHNRSLGIERDWRGMGRCVTMQGIEET